MCCGQRDAQGRIYSLSFFHWKIRKSENKCTWQIESFSPRTHGKEFALSIKDTKHMMVNGSILVLGSLEIS